MDYRLCQVSTCTCSEGFAAFCRKLDLPCACRSNKKRWSSVWIKPWCASVWSHVSIPGVLSSLMYSTVTLCGGYMRQDCPVVLFLQLCKAGAWRLIRSSACCTIACSWLPSQCILVCVFECVLPSSEPVAATCTCFVTSSNSSLSEPVPLKANISLWPSVTTDTSYLYVLFENI